MQLSLAGQLPRFLWALEHIYPGTDLSQYNKLTASQQLIFIYISTRNGNQVRVSLKDPRSDDAITASVVSKTASQIRLVFDRRFPLSDDVWR